MFKLSVVFFVFWGFFAVNIEYTPRSVLSVLPILTHLIFTTLNHEWLSNLSMFIQPIKSAIRMLSGSRMHALNHYSMHAPENLKQICQKRKLPLKDIHMALGKHTPSTFSYCSLEIQKRVLSSLSQTVHSTPQIQGLVMKM